MKINLFPVLAFLGILCSCKQGSEAGFRAVPLVESVISDLNSPERISLERFGSPDKNHSVFLIGPENEVRAMSDTLMNCDFFDNASGAAVSDSLPDFAGEVIVPVSDFSNPGYDSLVLRGAVDTLREHIVHSVLSTFDTLAFRSPYDQEGESGKPMPKAIVLTSSFCAEYGKHDIDTLFHSTGCAIPVICPSLEMFSQALLSGARNIAVIAPSSQVRSGLYSRLLNFESMKLGIRGASLYTFAVQEGGEPLVMLLDQYISSADPDNMKKIDAILIDDCTVCTVQAQQTLFRLTSILNEESLKYSGAVSSDVLLLDFRTAAARKCFRELRGSNLFTHAVRLPVSEPFMLVPLKEHSESGVEVSHPKLIRYNSIYAGNGEVQDKL